MDERDEVVVQITAYVPADLAEKVRSAADKDERTVSSWIRRVLARELEQSAA